MRIGIDAHILGKNQGGVERYVSEMVSRIPRLLPEHDFIVFITSAYARTASLSQNDGNVRYIPLPLSDPIFQRSLILPLLVKKHKIDLLHTQRVLPFFVGCKCLVSIHDILPLTTPEDHPGLRNAIIRKLTPWSAKKSVAILTVSNTVKNEIAGTLKVSEKKIKTVYNGVDHKTVPKNKTTGLKPAAPYILYAGAIEPRKNLLTLVTGFKKALNQFPGLKIVIVGMARDKAYKLKLNTVINEMGICDRVVFTGFVSDPELERLYREAEVFIAPSSGEGFDMPPLEAMTKGTPVICSDIKVHREVLKKAALFFNPASAEELASSIVGLLSKEEQKTLLIERGYKTANQYTWEKSVCQIAKIYLEAGAVNRSPGRFSG